MIIRKATAEDIPKIKELSQDSFYHGAQFDQTLDTSWPSLHSEYYEGLVNKAKVMTFVAEENDRIVGYLIGRIIKAENWRKNIKQIAELENMFIAERYRGQGIGKELIKQFKMWAEKSKVKHLKVIASAENTQAIEIYKRSGFYESALILEASL